MELKKLTLMQFRSYEQLSLAPGGGVTVLVGPNGAGKTNLLEAMHLLATGRSHRCQSDREMIRQGQPAAIIRGESERQDGRHRVEVRLYPQEKPGKRVLVEGKPARVGDLLGHVTCVMFSPEDLRIVRDGPAARRRFIDMQLSQIRPGYLRALKSYLTALDARNALLKRQRFAPMRDIDAQLDAWDEQLATAAVPVESARRWFAAELKRESEAQYALISEHPEEDFRLSRVGALAQSDDPAKAMLEGLLRARREDMERQYTAFGPHRDDLRLSLFGKPLSVFGSQGQIRTAVLALKLAELPLIQREMGDKPALLLDDVFSELDVRRRAALLQASQGVQTFLTCTDLSDVAGIRVEQTLRVLPGGTVEDAGR